MTNIQIRHCKLSFIRIVPVLVKGGPAPAPTPDPTPAPTPALVTGTPGSTLPASGLLTCNYVASFNYGFPAIVTAPTPAEFEQLRLTTQIFCTRLIAFKYGLIYDQVDVAATMTGVQGTNSIQVGYTVTIGFQLNGKIPTSNQVETVLEVFDTQLYLDDFVRPDTIFASVTSVVAIVGGVSV